MSASISGLFVSPIKPPDVREYLDRCEGYTGCRIHMDCFFEDEFIYDITALGERDQLWKLMGGTKHLIKWKRKDEEY